VILRGIKQTALMVLVAAVLSGCMAELPGGPTGPFAPGNTVTFFYQTVLTDPPAQAQIVECGDQFIQRSCVRQPNGAQFPLQLTETGGVAYGNAELRMVLQQDAGGLPSGVGMLTDLTTGEENGLRWVSLPS